MALTADEILGLANDLEIREVEIPGKGTVYLKALSGKERESWEASNRTLRPNKSGGFDVIPDQVNLEARLIVRALVDADGKRLFTDNQANAVGQLPSAVVKQLFDTACDMSGLGEQAETVIEGNSEAAPSGDSSSS